MTSDPDNIPSDDTPNFAAVKATIVEDSESSETPLIETPKKRGRPKGSTNKKTESENLAIDASLVGIGVELLFSMIASRNGEHWKLTKEESKAVSDLGAKVINKHSSDFMKAWGEEISLCIVCISIVTPRVLRDSEIRNSVMEPIPQEVLS